MNSAIETYRKLANYYDSYIDGFTQDLTFYGNQLTNIRNHSVLEIGCGTGRVMKYLLDAGCVNLTGVDISEDMLLRAKQNLKGYEHVQLSDHDFSNAPLLRKFDAVLTTFYTFNYILDQPEQFLRNVSESSTNNSMLILDLFVPKPVRFPHCNGVTETREVAVGSQNVVISDTRTMNGSIEHRHQCFDIEGTATEIDTYRRYYTPSEIAQLLNSLGYTEIHFYAGYDHCTELVDGTDLGDNYMVTALWK